MIQSLQMEKIFADDVSSALGIPPSTIDFNLTFTQLGGNSVSALTLISTCRKRGLNISIRSILGAFTIADLVRDRRIFYELCDPSSETSFSALTLSCNSFSTSNQDSRSENDLQPFPPDGSGGDLLHEITHDSRENQRRCPIPEMQLSLIHGSQKDPGINIIEYSEVHHPETVQQLRQAWEMVICSEPIFRTSYDIFTDRGYLIECSSTDFSWREVVVEDEESFVSERYCGVSDTTTVSGNEFKVVTLCAGGYTQVKSAIIWRVHHALIDGYSSRLIMKKVRRATTGSPEAPGPSFVALAQNLHHFREQQYEAGCKFWEQRQIEYPSAAWEIMLPPPAQQASGDKSSYTFVNIPITELGSHLRSMSVTMASLYYAAWALTMSIYMDSDELVFGSVMSGRDLPLDGVGDTVGLLMNVLPFHVRINREATSEDLLRQVSASLIDLAMFQWTTPEHGYSRHFSSIVAVQFNTLEYDGIGIDPIEQPECRVRSEIPLSVVVFDNGHIRFDYNALKFSKRDISNIGEVFQNAVMTLAKRCCNMQECMEALVTRPARDEISLLGNCFSSATRLSSIEDDLVSLFRRVIAQQPYAMAVSTTEISVSYEELDRLATRVAYSLCSVAEPQDIICVHADGSINWIIAIYGILIARCVYCPLDPSLPSEARDDNFNAAESKVFLAPFAKDKTHKPSTCIHFLAIDDLLGAQLAGTDAELYGDRTSSAIPQPSSDAYLCFTSGSTGKPKGVMCRHESLVAFQSNAEVRLQAEPGRHIAQIMSPAFDGSIHEIFSALSYGATLRLKCLTDPFEHLKTVDSAILTPTIAKLLNPTEFGNLRAVYFVGEAVSQTVSDAWSASVEALYNMYGPTETTCGATIKRLFPHQVITIGRPNPSTRLYILNSRQRIIPRGMIGEIYLGGIQVANGYIGRTQETSKRFLPDLIFRHVGERMYRTGDRGYWNEQGEVVCMGRDDRIIKLRGYRLDLDDLETRIARSLESIISVVVVQKDGLLAAVVQPSDVDLAFCRVRLAQILPLHARPTHIAAVDEFPMTVAGKIDYRSIIQSIRIDTDMPMMILKGSTEDKVASIWREVLSLSSSVPVFGNSNFADLGGNSIDQLRLANHLTRTFQQPITLQSVIKFQTLHELASEIDKIDLTGSERTPSPKFDIHQVSPIEAEWWNKYRSKEGTAAFNVSFACKVGPEANRKKLANAWNVVLRSHELLRSRYVVDENKSLHRQYTECSPRAQEIVCIDMWQEINRPFDLSHDDPIRVFVTYDHLLIVASHVIADLTTLQNLLREVSTVYRNENLAFSSRPYMQAIAEAPVQPLSKVDFWRSYLSSLPTDSMSFSNFSINRTSHRGHSWVTKIPSSLATSMHTYVGKHRVTMHQLSLAAVSLTLQYNKEHLDIVLGAPYLNRSSAEDHDVIGLFLEPLPIRIIYPTTTTVKGGPALALRTSTNTILFSDDFLAAVRGSSQAALANAIPWTELTRHLNQASPVSKDSVQAAIIDSTSTSATPIATSTPFDESPAPLPSLPLPSSSPLTNHVSPNPDVTHIFDVMLTFHEQSVNPHLAIPGLSPLYTWANGAKFKLLIEFLALDSETVVLRMEYDDACLTTADTHKIGDLVLEALKLLTDGAAFEAVREALKKKAGGFIAKKSECETRSSGEFWGMELDQVRRL